MQFIHDISAMYCFPYLKRSILKRKHTTWPYPVFANFLDDILVILIKIRQYLVFQPPNSDSKIQFLIENTTVTVFTQKFDYGVTVVFEKINGNTII